MCTKCLYRKYELIFGISIMSLIAPAQKKWYQPMFEKNDWVVYSAQYLTGISSGIREEVIYHPTQLFEMYPHLNRQWWDINVSYRNKYSESPLLVAFSDANHFFKSAGLITNCVSVGFSFGDYNAYSKKQRWKVIFKKIALSYITNKLGFATSYYLYFRNQFLL
jgi:hypothetical protein